MVEKFPLRQGFYQFMVRALVGPTKLGNIFF